MNPGHCTSAWSCYEVLNERTELHPKQGRAIYCPWIFSVYVKLCFTYVAYLEQQVIATVQGSVSRSCCVLVVPALEFMPFQLVFIWSFRILWLFSLPDIPKNLQAFRLGRAHELDLPFVSLSTCFWRFAKAYVTSVTVSSTWLLWGFTTYLCMAVGNWKVISGLLKREGEGWWGQLAPADKRCYYYCFDFFAHNILFKAAVVLFLPPHVLFYSCPNLRAMGTI